MKRRVVLAVLVALLGLGLGVLLSLLATITTVDAQGGGCWGSICQTSSGVVQFSQPLNPSQPISLSTAPGVLANPGGLSLACTRQALIGPGANAMTLGVHPGTKPGTMKLVGIAASGRAEITLFDNIPGGTC